MEDEPVLERVSTFRSETHASVSFVGQQAWEGGHGPDAADTTSRPARSSVPRSSIDSLSLSLARTGSQRALLADECVIRIQRRASEPLGIKYTDNTITAVDSTKRGAQSGLRVGMAIKKVNGAVVHSANELKTFLSEAGPNVTLLVTTEDVPTASDTTEAFSLGNHIVVSKVVDPQVPPAVLALPVVCVWCVVLNAILIFFAYFGASRYLYIATSGGLKVASCATVTYLSFRTKALFEARLYTTQRDRWTCLLIATGYACVPLVLLVSIVIDYNACNNSQALATFSTLREAALPPAVGCSSPLLFQLLLLFWCCSAICCGIACYASVNDVNPIRTMERNIRRASSRFSLQPEDTPLQEESEDEEDEEETIVTEMQTSEAEEEEEEAEAIIETPSEAPSEVVPLEARSFRSTGSDPPAVPATLSTRSLLSNVEETPPPPTPPTLPAPISRQSSSFLVQRRSIVLQERRISVHRPAAPMDPQERMELTCVYSTVASLVVAVVSWGRPVKKGKVSTFLKSAQLKFSSPAQKEENVDGYDDTELQALLQKRLGKERIGVEILQGLGMSEQMALLKELGFGTAEAARLAYSLEQTRLAGNRNHNPLLAQARGGGGGEFAAAGAAVLSLIKSSALPTDPSLLPIEDLPTLHRLVVSDYEVLCSKDSSDVDDVIETMKARSMLLRYQGHLPQE